MKLLTTKEVAFYSIPAIFGTIFTYAFGGWSGLLELFFISLVLDWITGISASIIEGKGLSSKQGFNGGIKKFTMILTVFFAHRADFAFDFDWVMTGVLYFWLANELTSIIENFGRIGIPFPEPLKRLITVLKEKSETQDSEQK